MKKVVSLILVVALFAGLAISASATAVVHNQGTAADQYIEVQQQIEHGKGTTHACADLNNHPNGYTGPAHGGIVGNVPGTTKTGKPYADGQAYASALVAASAQMVQINDRPEVFDLTWTTCAEAITVEELQGVIDTYGEDFGIKNLTVFYQRNIKAATAGQELTVTLWPCNPAIRHNQAAVILGKTEADGWKVLNANHDGKTVSTPLDGTEVAFAVCMAW